MSHYQIGDWVDFVRGVINGRKAAAMSAHLETGCAECLETREWLRNVTALASCAGPEVPQALIRRAESICKRPPSFRFEMLFPLVAQLVFDHGYAPQPIGVRTAGTMDHTLYRAGDFTVDLQQERSRGSDKISLVGQILRHDSAEEETNGFPVAVLAGKAMIANSISNRFGEFSLSYSRRPDLKLAIAVIETGRKVEIPLTRSAREKNNQNKEE